jgi:hypothetical protein
MNYELEFAYRVRRALDQGVDNLDARAAAGLRKSRQAALDRLNVPVGGLKLAGIGGFSTEQFSQQARGALAAMALLIGAVGTYYWNSFEQAAEHAEIDSALLADEVPFNAYLDQGFNEWLDHLAQQEDSDSSPQQ